MQFFLKIIMNAQRKDCTKTPTGIFGLQRGLIKTINLQKIMLYRFQGSQFFSVINNFGNRMNEFLAN